MMDTGVTAAVQALTVVRNGVHPEIMSRDLENASPLPEAQGRQNSLIFWFVYFLLIW